MLRTRIIHWNFKRRQEIASYFCVGLTRYTTRPDAAILHVPVQCQYVITVGLEIYVTFQIEFRIVSYFEMRKILALTIR